MCGEQASGSTAPGQKWGWSESDTPPDWENIDLPPDHILKHLTDAHCHPTDLNISIEEYDAVQLGEICAMSTTPEDQTKVKALGQSRHNKGATGPKVISSFGYHPWFTHRYTMLDPPPSKEEHYRSIFFSTTKETNLRHFAILEMLLPYLPDPLPFGPMLESLARDIDQSMEEGHIVLLGEVGLDGGARMRWPQQARHLYEEKYPVSGSDGDWNRLTPFKVSMAHQRAVVEAQMDVAVKLEVNISFHSVAAAGPTMATLRAVREKHNTRFNGLNVDIHSAGGWSPQFWKQAEKEFPNLYASPSILITSRSQAAPDLIRAISSDRLLVESDSHDVRLTTQLVWAATKWIAGCKGWKLEDHDVDWKSQTHRPVIESVEEGRVRLAAQPILSGTGCPVPEGTVCWCETKEVGGLQSKDERVRVPREGGDVWTVRTLERNMFAFLGLEDSGL